MAVSLNKPVTEIQKLVQIHNRPDLANQHGMVYQIWDDGEITLQKSGDLLWQRNLHQTMWPLSKKLPERTLPGKLEGHEYMFTTREGAEAIRTYLENA